MKHFDLLETKRRHVKTYSDKVPDKRIDRKIFMESMENITI